MLPAMQWCGISMISVSYWRQAMTPELLLHINTLTAMVFKLSIENAIMRDRLEQANVVIEKFSKVEEALQALMVAE